MSQTKTLRIDTSIKPSSLLRMLLYMSLTGIMLLLAWLAALSLMQYVVILIVSVAVASYLALAQPIVLHITQPPLNQRVDKGWQLLMRTSHGDALWQAELSKTYHYKWLIVFEFKVVEPYQRSLSVIIFRDQVSQEQWRKLNILASVLTIKAS